jgi:endonuclease/exonuclease/phosphatase family metal-dependent hydrolase
VNLTFVTYNLEYGGIDNGDGSRLDRQLRMLDGLGADVIALQECSNWRADGGRHLYRAEQALGMRGFIAASQRHPGGDLGIFIHDGAGIRPVETRQEERPPYWHGVAVLHAEVDGFGPLRFASAHLAPSTPTLRAVEAEALQLVLEKPVPVIIGGDFNAVPARDPEPDTTGVRPGKARRKLDRRAADALSEYMTDVAEHLGVTTPTVGHRGDRMPYRCDRIGTTLPPETLGMVEVIQEDSPESDHKPVLAVFNLTA